MQPLFKTQEKYNYKNILSKIREILGIESSDGMYAMAGKFRMLLRTSDGTEYDTNGKCDGIDYIKWYGSFLDNNDINGIGELSDFLYANINSFYNEETGDVFFTSEKFIDFIQALKDLYNHHKGEIDQ